MKANYKSEIWSLDAAAFGGLARDQILLRKIWGRKVSTVVSLGRAACRGCQEASKNTWHILNANYNAVAEAEGILASSEALAVA